VLLERGTLDALDAHTAAGLRDGSLATVMARLRAASQYVHAGWARSLSDFSTTRVSRA
jgi:hypothetical protein